MTTPPTDARPARLTGLATPAVVIATLAAMGAFHALWAGRQDKANDPAVLERVLGRMPHSVGAWEGEDVPNDMPEAARAKVGPQVIRRYVHRGDGQVVYVLLAAGPPGPITLNHRPTDCLPANGYVVSAGPTRLNVPLDGGSATFMAATFTKSDGPAPEYQRAFWSYSTSGTWDVPRALRLVFAKSPTVYKLYVIRALRKPDEPVGQGPGLAFLRELIPALRRDVFGSP